MSTVITLYSFVPFDRSLRVRWLASELGIQVIERKLDFAGAEHRGDTHLKRHPFGLVPVIEINGETRWESVAICQSLAEQRPEAGLTVPLAGARRPEYLSWLMFGASTLDNAAFAAFQSKALKPDEARHRDAKAALMPLLVQLARHMNNRPYLLGENFTLPDIIIGHSMQLLYLVHLLDEFPLLLDYRKRLASRPAAKSAGVFTPRIG